MENHELRIAEGSGEDSGARTHAPTLLGGDQPGEQGEARVWAPNPWRRRAMMTSLASMGVSTLFICYCIYFTAHLDSGGLSRWFIDPILLLECVVFLGVIRSLWQQVHRPLYVTTDNAGIGITTRRGARAMRWSEIRSVQRVQSGQILLITDSGPFRISPQTYAEGLAEDLFTVIVNRANLYRSPDDARRFLREEQIRERCLARQHDVILERPPMPAIRRFTTDACARRIFILNLTLTAVFAIFAVGFGLFLQLGLGNIGFIARHTLRYRMGSPEIATIELAAQLSGPGDESGPITSMGSAEIWVNQPPGAPLAVPDVPGYRALWSESMWAPVESIGALASLYNYKVYFVRANGRRPWPPRQFAASLADGSRKTFYKMQGEFSNFAAIMKDYPSYVNSETTGRKESGPAIKSIPPPRDWRYVGISVYNVREIAGVEFRPAPAVEHFDPADGKQPAAAAAAWLPGRLKGDRLTCDLIFRDGGVRRLALSPGVKIKGVKVIWKLPARFEKQLPKGPI
ncbi:MAG TPA: hypothetical protein VFJ58_18935 [Armatimonadota bacterium]|nr:hypothetical protein [Armatimonadota bacterium]